MPDDPKTPQPFGSVDAIDVSNLEACMKMLARVIVQNPEDQPQLMALARRTLHDALLSQQLGKAQNILSDIFASPIDQQPTAARPNAGVGGTDGVGDADRQPEPPPEDDVPF